MSVQFQSSTLATPPDGCGFQAPKGFQKSGFQNCAPKGIGWHPSWGFRHSPEELERRLAQQRGVSSAWFDDFIEAQRAAAVRVATSKSIKHRAVLDEAAAIVYAAVEEAITAENEPPMHLIAELASAAGASRVTASIRYAEMIKRCVEDDDEEEILLLMQ